MRYYNNNVNNIQLEPETFKKHKLILNLNY